MNDYQYTNGVHVGNTVARNNGIEVIECQQCGYAHRWPLPDPRELDDYYQQDVFYRTHGPRDWLVNERNEHTAGLWNSAYRWQAELIRGYGGYGLVDVGCGTGWFMKYYHDTYQIPFVVGIEPSGVATSCSPVGDRIYRDYNDLARNGNYLGPLSMDSLRMALVIEHVLDPRRMLREAMNRYLGMQGTVLLIAPNEFNPLQRRLARRVGYDWYVQGPHVNYFSKASLRRLVESCGLRVVHQSGTFPMELWDVLGRHYVGDDTLGRHCHHRRLQLEHKLGGLAWQAYYWLYKWFGWGRESILLAKR